MAASRRGALPRLPTDTEIPARSPTRFEARPNRDLWLDAATSPGARAASRLAIARCARAGALRRQGRTARHRRRPRARRSQSSVRDQSHQRRPLRRAGRIATSLRTVASRRRRRSHHCHVRLRRHRMSSAARDSKSPASPVRACTRARGANGSEIRVGALQLRSNSDDYSLACLLLSFAPRSLPPEAVAWIPPQNLR